MNIQVVRDSPAYQRITAAGFSIGEVRAAEAAGVLTMQADFRCVCGKTETFYKQFSPPEVSAATALFSYDRQALFRDGWDIAADLEDFGAVSVDHLRRDGYSEDEIKHIRRAYDFETEAN